MAPFSGARLEAPSWAGAASLNPATDASSLQYSCIIPGNALISPRFSLVYGGTPGPFR
jgi:hypothetical protein